jgi:GTP-binding protein
VLSAARPKIADYPFTTLVPNLGVVRRPSGDGTVFADIPGLIAGAAQGAGLGHDFLRHIERTRLLLHLVDAASEAVLDDLRVVERELAAYGHGLEDRPRLVVLNKIELLEPAELQALTDAVTAHCGREVLAVSAATVKNLDVLLAAVWRELETASPRQADVPESWNLVGSGTLENPSEENRSQEDPSEAGVPSEAGR